VENSAQEKKNHFNKCYGKHGPFFYVYGARLHISSLSKIHIMKNTTEQTFPLIPSLRVAFKHDEIVEEKNSKPVNSRKRAVKTKVQPSKSNLPLFDDYRIKAKDHDPL
jgi:hypothetical protein